MADLKTTNIYGDAYINNKVGIATNAPATRLQIGQLSPTAATEGIQFGDDTSTRIYRSGTGAITVAGSLTYPSATVSGYITFPNDTNAAGLINTAGTAWLKLDDAYGNMYIVNNQAGAGIYFDSNAYYWRNSNGATTLLSLSGNGDLGAARYLSGTYVNTSDDVSTGNISHIVAKFGDNYHRSATAAKVAAFISGQTMNIGGNAATVTTNANLSGDVTSVGNTTTIANTVVTNAKLKEMGASTIKGNNGASANTPSDLTPAQVATMLSGQTMNIAGSSTSCTGNAATATALTSMNISQFTNNSGYLTSAVTSLAGTTNRVTVSGATGAVTLNLPQDIHTGASPTFAGLTVAGGNATIYRDLIVNGGGSGNFGNRIIVQGTATTYTYQDTTLRPTVYLNGDYPVVTLNATATTNANHGPTLQFAFNGLTTGGATSRQIVIGANGVGSWLDFGFSGGANGDNSSYNPHNGISGYNGVTAMRLFSNGLLVGSTGAYPNNITSISYALDVRGTGYFSSTLTVGGNISAANLSGTNTGDQSIGNGTITIAAGTGIGVGTSNTFTTNQSGATTVTVTNSGVTSNVAGTGISVSGATGAVTITNSGVTSAVAGTGISVSGATGAVTITNSGVTSLAGTTNRITVSAGTGGVTLNLPQDIHTGASPTFAGLSLTSVSTTGATITNLTGAYQNTTVYDSPRTQSATPSRGIRAPASSIQFTDSYAIAPFYTYRSTGDWPVPYGIGWGTGGESSGIFQRYASNGSSFGDMIFYTGNDGSGAFSFRRHTWEGTTYFAAGSGELNTELFRIDWSGNVSMLGTLNGSANSATFYANPSNYGSWKIGGTRNGWYGIEFESGTNLMANSNEVGFHRNGSGWQMRWSAGVGYVYKGNPGGGTEAVILDSSNSPYANNMNQYVRTTDSPTFAVLQLTRLNFGATGAAPYNAASGEGFGNGITFGGDENSAAYRIFTGMENIGGNYSKLTLNWHTGIRIGAYFGYGGIRFYNNYVGTGTKVFSIAEGDDNVRVVNSLIVNGITINQERATNARMYGAGTGAFGLLGLDSAGSFRWQLYGEGSNYGFLNGAWAGWDIKKTVSGALYLNSNDTYYLNPASTTNLLSLTVANTITGAVSGNAGTVTNGLYTTGGQTIAGITYFSNGESMNVYGIRGRFTNEYLHLYSKVGVGHPGGWGQGETSTPTQGLSTYGGLNIAYGDNGISTFNGVIRANSNIRQGADLASPLSSWSVSGTSTGMVIFSFPGNTGNYGMVHCVFDIYEYNSNTVSTVIVGGHNWNGAWYNFGANVIGRCGKSVRLGVKDSRYCVVFGGAASSWDYGTIILRKIHNGGFYTGIMDMGGSFTTQQTATESFSNISGDLRALRTSADFIADGGISGTTGTFSGELNIAGNYQIRNTIPTITFRDTDHRTGFIHVNSNIFYILTGVADSGYGNWTQVANSRWPLELNLSNNNAAFGGVVDAISFTGAGTGLTGTAASLTAGAVTNGIYTTSVIYIGTTAITMSRSSAAQTLTGISIDGNAGSATYAMRLDSPSRSSFTVGGNKDTYYPVIFNIGGGSTVQQYSEFVIERGGYDDPGYTGIGFSTLNIRFSCKASGWGFGATYENVEMHGYTTQMVANWQQMSEASKLIVWLRGATIYNFWNVVANTTLHDGNSGGTSLTLAQASSYSYTYAPTATVQTKALYGKYINSSTGTSGIYVAGNVLAEGLFSGAGTGLTGTAASLSIGGNAATVTNGLYTNSTLTAGNLSGTIPSGVLGNSTLYVGSTAIALNRASAGQTLTGISIDGNAVTAGGLAVHGGTNNEANKIVRTDGNGYINAGWINTPSGDMPDTQSINRIYCSDDQYIRYKGVADFKQQIGLTYKNATPRSANTTDTNYWTGIMGWTGTDWNSMSDWGCGFVDSWDTPANRPPVGTHHVGIQALHYTNGTARYGWQMANGTGNNRWWLRDVWGGSFSTWFEILTSTNYTSFAPSLTGTGASGTWSINVTGTAGSISGFNNPAVAATANTIVYRSGGGDITGAYILGSYFNASAGNSENPTIGQIWTQNTTDNYLRKSTPAHFRSQVTDGSYPSLTGANASGTWSINVTGNAGTATTAVSATSATSATFLNSSNYIQRIGSSGNYNTDFQNTPAGSVRHIGDDYAMTNNPGAGWWFVDSYRHSNGNGYWGTQVAWGWEDNANRLATRNVQNGSYGGWVYYLNSANYNSYSPTLTGTGASGTWSINVTGNAGGSSTSCTGNAATATALTSMNISQFTNNSGYLTSVTNISGNAATATLATKASTLSQGGGTGTGMTFNWSGQGGQPTWLWGSNDGTNIYVWNPSNFNVNYATSAGSATSATTATTANALNTSNNYRVTNFGIDISPANKLHINGDNVNPTIRVDNGAIVTGVASNSKSFYGFMPVSISGTTKYIQLWN